MFLLDSINIDASRLTEHQEIVYEITSILFVFNIMW